MKLVIKRAKQCSASLLQFLLSSSTMLLEFLKKARKIFSLIIAFYFKKTLKILRGLLAEVILFAIKFEG